jgi:hypothetical protein
MFESANLDTNESRFKKRSHQEDRAQETLSCFVELTKASHRASNFGYASVYRIATVIKSGERMALTRLFRVCVASGIVEGSSHMIRAGIQRHRATSSSLGSLRPCDRAPHNYRRFELRPGFLNLGKARNLNIARSGSIATLITDRQVLVEDSERTTRDSGKSASTCNAALYDPSTKNLVSYRWLNQLRTSHPLRLLLDGQALAAGGFAKSLCGRGACLATGPYTP